MSEHHPEQQDFPHDRYDDVARYTTQQGAHRKEFPAPKGTGHLNTIILAGGAALAIGVGSYLWLAPSDPLNLSASDAEEALVEPEESQQPEEPTDDAATQEPEADEELTDLEDGDGLEDDGVIDEPEPTDMPDVIDVIEPDEDLEESSEPTDPEAEESQAGVDYDLPIYVYNASNIQGYAASIAQELGGAGFNVPVADNWTGNVPNQTVVYYSSNEGTARAVAEQIGGHAVYEPSVNDVLVVLTAN